MPNLDATADLLYERLQQFALSWGLLDIGVEQDDRHIDCELLFSSDPDMGFSYDTASGTCRYCVLVGDDEERWLEHEIDQLDLADGEATAAAITDGLLAARREAQGKAPREAR